MTGHRRWGSVGATMAAAAFVLASCGGGSSGSDTIDGMDGGDATEQTDGSDSGDADLGDISGDCVRAGAAFSNALNAFDTWSQSVGSGTLTVNLDMLKSDIEEARGAVPGEIRGAFDTYMDAFIEYAELLSGLDPTDYTDPAVLDRLGQAAASFGSAEVMEAMNQLTEYFTQTCVAG